MDIPVLKVRSALTSPVPVLDFVLPGLVPKTAGIVVGPGAIGKTMLLTQIAMYLSAQVPALDVFGVPAKPGRTVLIAAEESEDILRIRLHAINNWMRKKAVQAALPLDTKAVDSLALLEENLAIVPASGYPVGLVKNGEVTKFFGEICKFCKGARLVIIDPLRRLHDGDENSSAAMTHIVQTLESLAVETGAAVIAAHHMSKAGQFGGSSESASASRGSSALTDAVRWQLNLSTMSEAEAKALGVLDSRKLYVRLDFAKANYVAQQDVIWLKRVEGGVLARAIFDDAADAKSNRRTGRSTRPAAGDIYV